LLDSLWRQQREGYYDNPLPETFKESLLALLANSCASPYFRIAHACRLYEMGVPPREILRLAEIPAPAPADVEQARALLAGFPRPIAQWPEQNPVFGEGMLTLCAAVFLGLKDSELCADALQDLLGEAYGALMLLLAYAKSAHFWLEAHPEIGCEAHPTVRRNFFPLVRQEPHLVEVFQNHRSRPLLMDGGERADAAGDGAAEGGDRYRELIENSADIICTYDFSGRLLSANPALERIVGYPVAEALQMRIADIIHPEYAHLGERLTDPAVVGETPFHCELDVVTKDGGRVALGVSTRPVFLGGKPVAVHGTARDVTRRKQAESALEEANRRLEAWVAGFDQRNREMALLNEMGDILRACPTMEEAHKVILGFAQQIFPVKVGALYILAPAHDVAESVLTWGDPDLAERVFFQTDCWALRRGRAHCVENDREGMVCKHVRHPPADGYVCIPLMAQSEAIGVLHMMQPDGVRMTEERQRLAVALADHIAMTLSNLRLHETLRTQAIRDPLTGLFNRRFMEESLALEIRRATRNSRSLGMIMIDLDHFKYFNDTFGHEAGDLLLKQVGLLLQTNIRGEDIACRFGGEEFTLILPEGNSAATQKRADFYRDAIQRLEVNFKGASLGHVTASMGVAVFPDHGRSAQTLIAAADKAMYRSKNEGRNRVTLAG
jgi:diguanylate cyclase (GGDEF)-like protein/PAS domain S-box-containing protein